MGKHSNYAIRIYDRDYILMAYFDLKNNSSRKAYLPIENILNYKAI